VSVSAFMLCAAAADMTVTCVSLHQPSQPLTSHIPDSSTSCRSVRRSRVLLTGGVGRAALVCSPAKCTVTAFRQPSNGSAPLCGTGDYVKTKRALIRAVEKQAEMSEKMDLLKAELEALDRNGGGGGDHSASVSTSAHSGGFGAGGFGAGAI
jgi:hypothetical protein